MEGLGPPASRLGRAHRRRNVLEILDWPFKSEFLITYLSPDYSQTVIGRNKRDCVWIMARTPQIPEADYQVEAAEIKVDGVAGGARRRATGAPAGRWAGRKCMAGVSAGRVRLRRANMS